jgi:hypothetical protein
MSVNSTRLHGAVSQKTVIYIFTAVRIGNLTHTADILSYFIKESTSQTAATDVTVTAFSSDEEQQHLVFVLGW